MLVAADKNAQCHLGFDNMTSTENPVPEGLLIIAQRFNVGTCVVGKISPGGTADRWNHSTPGSISAVPPGLISLLGLDSNVETLGYCHQSLRDELRNPSSCGQECRRSGLLQQALANMT
jgi:hypothetical protein